jgi:hypothetical protein
MLQISSPLISDYEPVYAPTGQTNARRARCAGCRAEIPARAGEQWDYSGRAYNLVPRLSPSYFCPACHQYRYELLLLQPEIRLSMEQIESWCREYVTLDMGWHAIQKIERLVGKAGLLGADVASTIAERLPLLRDTSYGTVCDLAKSVCANICP